MLGQTSSRASDDGALAPAAGGRYRVALRPAVGEHERRKLVGCLEDLTVDRVSARRPSGLGPRPADAARSGREANSSSSEPGRTTGRGWPGLLGLAGEGGVAVGLELVGELGTALGDDGP